MSESSPPTLSSPPSPPQEWPKGSPPHLEIEWESKCSIFSCLRTAEFDLECHQYCITCLPIENFEYTTTWCLLCRKECSYTVINRE